MEDNNGINDIPLILNSTRFQPFYNENHTFVDSNYTFRPNSSNIALSDIHRHRNLEKDDDHLCSNTP